MGKVKFLSKRFKEILKEQYMDSKRFYERLVDEVLYILQNAISKKKIKVHIIAPRKTKIKTFESFYNNVKQKEIRENQFEVIQDIAGIRVICLYRFDLETIGNIIQKNFEVISVDTSRTRTVTPFGYISDHYIVRLPKQCRGARYDDVKKLPCEIQVRTILMDAWASVSHHLDYKQEVDIPLGLRTDFNALAGLFYVADTHFEMFKEGIENSRKALRKTLKEGLLDLDQEVNLDSVRAYGKWKFPNRRELTPSRLISDLIAQNYNTLRKIDEGVNTASPVITAFEKEIVEMSLTGRALTSAGMIWASLDLADPKFYKKRARASPEIRKRLIELDKKYRAKIK